MNEYDKERFDEAVPEIKRLIEQKEFDHAKSMLDEFALNDYAKWCFIYAEMRYAQGWMNEAYHYYKRAHKLDRYNTEYSDAFDRIYKMKYPENPKSNKILLTCAVMAGGCGILCGMTCCKSLCVCTSFCVCTDIMENGCYDYAGGCKMG